MPDYQVTKILIELREAVGLSQEYVARNVFDIRRRTFGDWENGVREAQARYRDTFRTYLLHNLGLIDNIDKFLLIWQEVAVGQWNWEPLSRGDLWLLRQIEQQQTRTIIKPGLPPYLVTRKLQGREATIAKLQTSLEAHDSALVGMPGVGKTALALALASTPWVQEHYQDSILWASLGPSPDISSILGKWARALGRDISDITDLDLRHHAVKKAIGNRQILLIIDDVWNETEALYLRCGRPNSRHFFTTRNESSLSQLVTAEYRLAVEELGPDDAYALLKDMAPQACQAHEQLARNLADLTGGLPLTIVLLSGYLAAPEAHFLTHVTESRLIELRDSEKRLLLAQRRLGTATNKTMSLKETIALSLDTLPTEIAQGYYRLGAFAAKPAGFDVLAAQAIGQIAIETVGLFIDRHLLEVGVNERLLLHLSLAEFARTQMDISVISQHRDYYLQHAEKDKDNWQQIEAEYDQIRWAWQQQLSQPVNSAVLLRFTGVLRNYQLRRGLWDECRQWSEAALSPTLNNGQLSSAASLYSTIAHTYERTGNRAEALEYYSKALDLWQQLDDRLGQAQTFHNIANTFHSIGAFQDAREFYGGALNIVQEFEQPQVEATIRNNMGRLLVDLDQIEDALDHLTEALNIYQKLDNLDGQMTALVNLAAAYIYWGNYNKALDYLDQAGQLNTQLGNRPIEATIYGDLGTVMLKKGYYEQAENSYQKALTIYELTNDIPGEARIVSNLGNLFRHWGQETKSYERSFYALEYYYRALNLQMEVQDRSAQIHTLGFIGILHEEVGNLQIALDYYEQSLSLAQTFPNRLDEAAAHQKIGEVSYKMGNLERAVDSYQAALALVLEHGTLLDERALRINLALAYRHSGKIPEAITQMQRVLVIDQRLQHPDIGGDQDFLARLQALH